MDFYNTNFKTRYDSIQDDDEGDVMYRRDLLEVFQVSEDSEFDVMTKNMEKVYQRLDVNIKNHPKFKEILTKSAARLFSEDLEIGFTLLYSFDTFYLIHQFLSEYFNTQTINDDILEKILNII